MREKNYIIKYIQTSQSYNLFSNNLHLLFDILIQQYYGNGKYYDEYLCTNKYEEQ